ncbi:MAG: hypothetical protein GF419_03635, partial [Ignavibacteriales bacterium]|nr:hypothetical protein [Ignavibacteriales bacterium]
MKRLFQAFVFLALASWFAMPSFAQTDLTVGFIHRSPEYNWVWDSPNPETEGWPSVGEAISWDACVKNYGATALTDVAYAWAVNGQIVETGTVDIPADDTVYVHYHTTWSFDRDTLMFVVDSDDAVSEEEEENNVLTTYTDAITVGFWVEQTVYDYFHDHQHELAGVHSNSWEDWAQRHVARWNDMLRDAKNFAGSDYDITPNGCLDRIRLDAIHVVPDDALPIGGGSYPGNYPDRSDSTVDLMWGFPVDLVDNGFYNRTTEVSDNNPFYFEGSLFHELGHARYLIDIYGFNVHDKIEWGNIQIMEDGANIVGTSYMPLLAPWYDAVHHQTIKGLMGGDYTYVDEYSAGALNLIAGNRATKGAWNSPGNIGEFMQDLPDENILTLIDSEGDPIPGASVEVYQSKGKTGDWYGKSYVDTPDLTFTADAEGNVAMGRCPFAIDGHISHTYGISEGVIIVRVEFDGRVEYHFMESMYFNMEYWSGRTDTGYYQIQTDFVARSIVFSNPESGAAWLPDVQKTITWEALGVSSISLHFSSDNGANWTELESSYDASLESYTWTTPNVESNQCKFRAIDLSDGTTAFESDVFSITASGAATPTIDGALTIEPEWGDPIGINTTDTSLYEPAIREVYAKEGEDHYYFGVLFRRTDCRLNTTLLFDYKTGGP